MKLPKNNLTVLLLLLLMITGCIYDEQPYCPDDFMSAFNVSVSPNTVLLSYQAHTPALQYLTVTCLDSDGLPDNTFPWTLSISDASNTWLELTLDPNGLTGKVKTITGTGSQFIYLVAQENTTAAIRTVELSMDGGETVAVNVTQEMMPLTVTPPAITLTGVPHTPATQTVSVSSNEPWTLTSNRTWLQLTLNENGSGASNTISSSGSQTVYLVVPGNGDDVREAELYLNGIASDVRVVVLQESLIAEQGQAAPRIYITGTTGEMKLMLTKKPTNYGAYFQFGSVIGWNWDDVNATYNPTLTHNLSYWSPSWNNGNKVVEHSNAELLLGMGDPCRLVGYTVSEIRIAISNSRTLDNTQWRLPLNTENIEYGLPSSEWHSIEGVNGRFFTGTNEFLPAAGRKVSESGEWGQRGSRSNYISATIDVDTKAPFSLFFNNQSTSTADLRDGQAQGFSVRCVRQ